MSAVQSQNYWMPDKRGGLRWVLYYSLLHMQNELWWVHLGKSSLS